MLDLAVPWLVIVFLVGAAATWAAGIRLSKTTDALDVRFNLGAELGGILLLAIAGTLPELAITVSAAAQGDLSLAAGNLIGGSAVRAMGVGICGFRAGGGGGGVDVRRRGAHAGARGPARRPRGLGRADGRAAAVVGGDRRRRKPGVRRDRSVLAWGRCRYQPGPQEPALERVDAGQPPW